MALEDAAIDALVRGGGAVLRCASPERVELGVAQVRRGARREPLELMHLVFAPCVDRPLLLSVVHVRNHAKAPVVVDYTEMWYVRGVAAPALPGAAVCRTELGARALADLSAVAGAEPPDPPTGDALVLEARFALDAGALREICFGYVAADVDEDPAPLVHAWRGDVPAELERSVAAWRAKLPEGSDPVEAYRDAD